MAKVIRKHWQSEAVAGLPRRDRQSCEYDAYVPDPLMGRAIVLEGAVAADVADAEAAIIRLNLEAGALVDTEALARLLLRAESVASSKIEGLEIGPRRLLEAEAAQALGVKSSDVTASEVLGNIEAMVYAVRSARSDEEFTLGQLLEIHRRLLAGSRLEESGGKIRSEQNWIGGSSYNPCSAAFVPPPPELVHDLLARPLPLLQRRRAACCGASSAGARPIRDHPPVHRRQRPDGTSTDPPDPAAARSCPAGAAARLTPSGHLGGRLCRGARRHAVPGAVCLSGGPWRAEPMDRAVCHGLSASGRRCLCVRCARAGTRGSLAGASQPGAHRLCHRPAAARAARRTGPHGPQRRRSHLAQPASDERGDRQAERSRGADAGHLGAAQPRLRSARADRCVHRSRAPARQPERRHARVAAEPKGAAATVAGHALGARPQLFGVVSEPS